MTRRFNNNRNPYRGNDDKDTRLDPRWIGLAILLMAAVGIGALAVHFYHMITLDCL